MGRTTTDGSRAIGGRATTDRCSIVPTFDSRLPPDPRRTDARCPGPPRRGDHRVALGPDARLPTASPFNEIFKSMKRRCRPR
jgi:hypothetical protein